MVIATAIVRVDHFMLQFKREELVIVLRALAAYNDTADQFLGGSRTSRSDAGDASVLYQRIIQDLLDESIDFTPDERDWLAGHALGLDKPA